MPRNDEVAGCFGIIIPYNDDKVAMVDKNRTEQIALLKQNPLL